MKNWRSTYLAKVEDTLVMQKDKDSRAPHRYSTTMEKLLVVVEFLAKRSAKESVGIVDISRGTGIEKASVYRALNTLLENNYVLKRDSGYGLSSKIVWLAGEYLDHLDVRRIAHSYLRELAEATGELSFLAIREGTESVIIEKAEGSSDLRIFSHIGSRFPLHCGATGKLFLAFAGPEERGQLLSEMEYTKYTENTIVDSETMERHLEEVRQSGIARNDFEQDYQKRAIAVPIFDANNDVVAAVSVAGLGLRLTEERMVEVKQLLLNAGARISEEMGYYAGGKSEYWRQEQ